VLFRSRRNDWVEAHKAEILKTNALDPANTWNYDDDDGSDSDKPEEAD